MCSGDTNEAVQMLDILLEFFSNGAHWTRGRYHDGQGRYCLIGALHYLRRKHHVPSGPAVYFLQAALPRRTCGLVYFNDHRWRSFEELRAVIRRARAPALGEAERERAAAAVKRWLLAALKQEHTARLTGNEPPTSHTGPRAPGELALVDTERARSRQAA